MSPEDIAYRACAVALSDLAACGAVPKWYSLALTLPKINENWLKDFSHGLNKFSNEYRVPLVGGDTTKGPLSITIQVMGAKKDQLIFVSGMIGNAYLGLNELKDISSSNINILSYLNPKARIELGQELLDIASSAIDISDGLLQDLSLICKASDVGAEIFLDKIPTSVTEKSLELINSGDDYELCFTTDKDKYDKVMNISTMLNIPITSIGKITSSKEVVLYDNNKTRIKFKSGYKHF
jgi:thiamine-monophosphate kinase